MSTNKDNLSKMINSLVNSDGDSFTSEFDSIIKNRISDELVIKGLEVHSELLNNIEEPDTNESIITEKAAHGEKYTFSSSSSLKNFVSAVKQAGGGKKGIAGPDIHIKGKTVSIDVADKETLDVISMISKEFKGKHESVEFIDIIQTILKEGCRKVDLMDESSVLITNKMAKSLVRLHDSLNNNNQNIMKDLIFKSKEGYREIYKLAKETENGST